MGLSDFGCLVILAGAWLWLTLQTCVGLLCRVMVERTNEELRKHDGFNGQRSPFHIHLSSCEAQVARGFANQRRTLHNLGLRTDHAEKHGRCEFTDDEDADATDGNSADTA